jgi:hypothetical protein
MADGASEMGKMGTTRPPRLKAKPMAGRRGDAKKRRGGESKAKGKMRNAEAGTRLRGGENDSDRWGKSR